MIVRKAALQEVWIFLMAVSEAVGCVAGFDEAPEDLEESLLILAPASSSESLQHVDASSERPRR